VRGLCARRTECCLKTEISVIIPTNRSSEVLAPCLQALASQTMALGRFEVLVVNDGATHDLSALATRSLERGLRLRVLDVPHGGPGPARNRGAAAAAGELLVFTDDDCVPEPGWLDAFAAAALHDHGALLGGRVFNLLPHRAGSEASQVLVDFLYDHYNRDPRDARFFTSNNIAAHRDVFIGHGGFDPSFVLSAGEDRDLCARWRERGGRLVYVPEARVGHAHDLTVKRFWKQHFRYGKGAATYWQARRRQNAAGLTVEPPRFYWDLMRYPLQHRRFPGSIVSLFLIGLSQVANALGFFVAARRMPAFADAPRA
jgi:GT2 family glycosyltransferase